MSWWPWTDHHQSDVALCGALCWRGTVDRVQGPLLGVGSRRHQSQRHHCPDRQQPRGNHWHPNARKIVLPQGVGLFTGWRGQDVLPCLVVPDGWPRSAQRSLLINRFIHHHHFVGCAHTIHRCQNRFVFSKRQWNNTTAGGKITRVICDPHVTLTVLFIHSFFTKQSFDLFHFTNQNISTYSIRPPSEKLKMHEVRE